MNLLIDNNDGLGPVDYTGYLDVGRLPAISRTFNRASTLTAGLLSGDATLQPPVVAARIIVQRADGYRLFTGYLTAAPQMEYLGQGELPAWRYLLHATDDSCLLDHNGLPARAPFATRSAGNALKTLANDVLPGGLDESGVQDVTPVNQFVIVPQKTWTDHAGELSIMGRANYRAHDGKLTFQPVGAASFTISDHDPNFCPHGLALLQTDKLRNDITIMGELEPLTYVRDYFLGDGTALGFYLSQSPYGKNAVTVLKEDYTGPRLNPTLWDVVDPNGKISLNRGQLQINGGPATVSLVEQVELAGGLMMQHGQFIFQSASSGLVGGIYNGAIAPANCIAGFNLWPSGSNSCIQAVVNGVGSGPVLTTAPGHQYSFATQLFSNEGHRLHQTYLSSTHPAGNGRGGDAIAAALRIVLTVHDVDPNNPGTIGAPATVLYDTVLSTSPGFATYALIAENNVFAGVSFTRLQQVVDAEIRSMIPAGQFRTRLAGGFADGGECYITSAGELHFYPPYPPQQNEQMVVTYRSSGRAVARVQDGSSIAQHAKGSDAGRRSYVRKLKVPRAPTSIDCETAASALLDDTVQPAWQGEYQVAGEFLPVQDVLPGDAVQIAVASRQAWFTAIVREVGVQAVSLFDDRSHYIIKFANDACQPLAFEFESITLSVPEAVIYDTLIPSSSLYINSLTAAQVTNVIASQITIDGGVAPPSGGGIEVRRSNGGWGSSDSGNLAGRFTTQTLTLPRLSRVQGYYLRQFDGSSPAKYSRYSTLLHVSYPL